MIRTIRACYMAYPGANIVGLISHWFSYCSYPFGSELSDEQARQFLHTNSSLRPSFEAYKRSLAHFQRQTIKFRHRSDFVIINDQEEKAARANISAIHTRILAQGSLGVKCVTLVPCIIGGETFDKKKERGKKGYLNCKLPRPVVRLEYKIVSTQRNGVKYRSYSTYFITLNSTYDVPYLLS